MVTKENLSYSFASQLLNKSFDQIRYDMANPTPPTPKMDAGSRMEYVLKHGLDSLNLWTKTKTKGKEFDAHLKALQSEIELYEAHPYLVVTEVEYDACEMMVNHLREEVVKVVDHAQDQVYAKDMLCGVPTHGYADLLMPDCVIEVKFTNASPVDFARQVVNMNWDLQCYVYTELFKRSFRWLVISDKAPHLVTIFDLPDNRFYESGRNKFEKATQLFNKFNLGMREPVFQSLDAPSWL